MVNCHSKISTRCGYTRRKLTKEREQAILLTLLEVPEFRRKAGLPPREGGDTIELCGKLLGCSREAVRLIERSAMHKLRAACCADPELRHALEHILHITHS